MLQILKGSNPMNTNQPSESHENNPKDEKKTYSFERLSENSGQELVIPVPESDDDPYLLSEEIELKDSDLPEPHKLQGRQSRLPPLMLHPQPIRLHLQLLNQLIHINKRIINHNSPRAIPAKIRNSRVLALQSFDTSLTAL